MGFYIKRNEDRHTERQRVRERVSASVGQRRGKRRSTFTNNVGSVIDAIPFLARSGLYY